MRKGIIPAGGSGTRLYPITRSVSKQLLPAYDKLMIYYPLSTLMLVGIRDIPIISTPEDTPRFTEMLGDGSKWGLSLQYAVQPSPDGLAQTFIIGRDPVGNDPLALILGDNIFHGHDLIKQLERTPQQDRGATVSAYHIHDPEHYGVVEFDENFRALPLEEKPSKLRSNHTVTGSYFYNMQVYDIAADVKSSARGELETTDVNKRYLEQDSLDIEIMGRDYAWSGTRAHDSLFEATASIVTLQKRQGLMVACPEEIMYRKNRISLGQVEKLVVPLAKSGYGAYLKQIAVEHVI